MTKFFSLKATALFLVGISVPLAGLCQTYQISRPVNGGSDFSIYQLGTPKATFSIPDGALSETVTVDPVGATIRQVGTLTLPSSFQSVVWQENQQFLDPPIFPNPPVYTTVPGDVTVSVSFGETVSFDTGLRPISWNGNAYSYDGSIRINQPLNISYSLLTGGQTYTGSVQYNDVWISTGYQIEMANYPTSIALSPEPIMELRDLWMVGFPIVDLTAANRFHLKLDLVPEPSTFALAVLGAAALAIRRRKQGSIAGTPMA